MKDNGQDKLCSILSYNRRVIERNIVNRENPKAIIIGRQDIQQSVSSLKKTTSCCSLKGQLAEQLISRMRRVSRVCIPSPQNSQNSKILLKNISRKRVIQEMQQCRQKQKVKKMGNNQAQINQKYIGKNVNPNKAQQKINDLTLSNEKLRKTINQLQQQLFIYKQQIEKMLQEIKENKQFMNQLQDIICKKNNQITQLINEVHYLRVNSCKQKKENRIKLSIQHIFNEIVTPYPSFANMALFKARQQSASLRKRLKQAEREREKLINEFSQQKNEQITRLKDHFAASIQYYKKALIKFTTKQKQETYRSKLSELLQSTGLEMSSAQQA